MFLDFALIILLFYLTIPASAGYFAYSHGQRFWLWFGLGFFLPILTHLLLYGFITIREIRARRNPDVLSPKEERHMALQVRKAWLEIRAQQKRRQRS